MPVTDRPQGFSEGRLITGPDPWVGQQEVAPEGFLGDPEFAQEVGIKGMAFVAEALARHAGVRNRWPSGAPNASPIRPSRHRPEIPPSRSENRGILAADPKKNTAIDETHSGKRGPMPDDPARPDHADRSLRSDAPASPGPGEGLTPPILRRWWFSRPRHASEPVPEASPCLRSSPGRVRSEPETDLIVMPESQAFTVWTEATRKPAAAASRPLAFPPSRAFTVWSAAVKTGAPGRLSTAGGRTSPPPSRAFTVWTAEVKARVSKLAPAISPPSRAFTVWADAAKSGTLGARTATGVHPATVALPPSRAFTVWTRSALAPAAAPSPVSPASPAPASIFTVAPDEEGGASLSRTLVRRFAIATAAVLAFTAFYQLSGEVKDLKRDKSELIGVQTDLEVRLGASAESNRQLEEEGRNLTLRLGETRQQLAQTQNANQSLERLVTDLRGEITTWKADMKEATDRHAAAKESMEATIASNKTRIGELETDRDSTRNLLQERESALAAREKALTARDQAIATLKAEAEKATATIAEIQGKLTAVGARLEEVQATAKAQAAELATANERLTAAAEAAVKAQARIAELEAALRAAEEAARNPQDPEVPPGDTPPSA